MKSTLSRIASKIDLGATPSDCWIWRGARSGGGYGQVNVGRGSPAMAHRIAYEVWRGPIPDGLLVCHTCDNRPCCNPAHLFLGTHADNMRDMMSKGRTPDRRGERAGRAKLTDGDVREIRRMAALGIAQSELARRFGIGKSAVFAIVSRTTWRHI